MHGQNDTSILLVDDNELFREAMATLLEGEGYAVETAGDGDAALEVLHGGLTPSLILLDLVMPRKNGLQFRAEQLEDARLAAIPTIAYSTDSDMQPKAESVGLAFFQKPDVRSILDYVASLRLQTALVSPRENLMADTGGFSAADWRRFVLD